MKTTPTLFDQAKSWLNELTDKIHLSGPAAINALIYLAAGFLIGFFLNRYLRSFLLGIILSIIVIGGLHYLQVITIDVPQLKGIVGIDPEKTIELYFFELVEWVKAYPLLAISGFVGFILGYKSC